MSFNLQQYLTENNLTLIGKARSLQEEQEEDVKPVDQPNPEKNPKEIERKKQELIKLQARVKDIIMKYTIDTPEGRKIKDVEGYKKAVGTLPQQIKNLQQQLGTYEENDN